MTLPSTHASIPDYSSKHPILVVLLGRVFSDNDIREEVFRVTDARSRHVLTGSNHFWPCYAYPEQVEEDVFGNSGTLTDVYDCAAAAKAHGWKALVLFDELSWRQLKGTVTNHEDPTLSAIVVNLECMPSAAVLSPDSTFFLRRLPLISALASAFLAEPQQPKDWSQVAESARRNHAFQLHLQSGFYLYSPYDLIFGAASTAMTPQRDTVRLQDLIDTNSNHQDFYGVNILIQPLIQLGDNEIEAARNLIQAEHSHHTFVTGRWTGLSPATRRDVSKILGHYAGGRGRIIFILSPPVEGKPLDTAVFVPPTESFEYGMLCRGSPRSLSAWWRVQGNGPSFVHEEKSQLDAQLEVYIDPLMTYPRSLPPYYKKLPLVQIDRENDAGYPSPECMHHRKYLVFYLTNSLSSEEKESAQAMVTAEEDDVEYDFIPWTKDVDGGPEDMLRLMKMVQLAENVGYTTEQSWLLIFIDQRFRDDGKAVACTWEKARGHGYKGIKYGRMDEDFEGILVNIPGNMDFEDFVPEDETEHLLDPDSTLSMEPVEEEDN